MCSLVVLVLAAALVHRVRPAAREDVVLLDGQVRSVSHGRSEGEPSA